jgi:hypothetical protein
MTMKERIERVLNYEEKQPSLRELKKFGPPSIPYSKNFCEKCDLSFKNIHYLKVSIEKGILDGMWGLEKN